VALLCFVSRLDWNSEMLIFVDGRKPEYLEKVLGVRMRTENIHHYAELGIHN